MQKTLQDSKSTIGRTQLSADDIEACDRHASENFPDHALEPVAQGGCSYTLMAKTKSDDCSSIVQFRLPRYALPLETATTAYHLYSTFAPETHELRGVSLDDGTSLQVLRMSCIPGIRLSDVQPRTPILDVKDFVRMQLTIRSFSTFFARQWFGGACHSPTLSGCTAKVGCSLVDRLRLLELQLPGSRLRRRAGVIRQEVENGVLDSLPIVLTHGDLLPSNIMVDSASFEISGYVDWAEAEFLPFGISLYGLEHLLGYLDHDPRTRQQVFTYYAQAEELRALFWTSLQRHVHEVDSDAIRHAIDIAAELGILLWHGFAWDDGRIDRVIDAEHDDVEVEYLQKFLCVQLEPLRRDSAIVDGPAASPC
ncbi:hypothetical protein LTR86_006362 [Recurvomyces mirabilis]|nr:hypothetical protein LTR86_006362 [Recurvomyces mirabilis]